jgi:hypothetical protein
MAIDRHLVEQLSPTLAPFITMIVYSAQIEITFILTMARDYAHHDLPAEHFLMADPGKIRIVLKMQYRW